MRLPSRRPLAEARIGLGSFDRFLLLYGTLFAAFGVASPFLPALLHEHGLDPAKIGAVLAAGTAVRLITGPIISRLADRFGKHQQILTVLLAMAAVIAFGYGLPAGFAIFLIVSVAHASTLAPIVPIADAMTLAAAPGRFQYGWVRGGASAAFVVGAVGAGQVVQATNLGGIIWMNGALLALAAVAALRLPRNALDRPLVPRRANVSALLAAPGFLPLMALAALVMSTHALHDGFEVLRWEDGGIGPSAAGLLWSEGVLAEVGRFRGGRPDAAAVAWASRRGRSGCQRGNSPLERHRCHGLAPGDGARGTATWSDIRAIASGLHADAFCGCPASPRRETGRSRSRRRVGSREPADTLTSAPRSKPGISTASLGTSRACHVRPERSVEVC
jgi:hypothetical protein